MRTVRLGDLATVELSGIDKKAKKGEKSVKLVNFMDVYDNWIITSEILPSLMVATASNNQINKLSLKKGQVALTKDSETRDDIGIPTYIAEDIENCVLGYHCALITPNESELNGAYLNTLLHTKYAMEYFEFNSTGSGQRYTLTKEIIEDFPVFILGNVNEQEKIAEIFLNIEKKIKLNYLICDTLTSMAKQIYEYWFIQFDYPNNNRAPYKSSGGKLVWNEKIKRNIPVGWKVEKINNLLGEYPKTKTVLREDYKKGNQYPIIDQSQDFICGYTDDEDKVLHMDDAIVFGDHTNLAKYVNFDFARGADGTQIINSNNKSLANYILYLQICSLPVIEKGYSRHYKFLKEQYVLVPEKKINDEYMNVVTPYLQTISNVLDENKKLAELREFLLPLMMDGQIRIK